MTNEELTSVVERVLSVIRTNSKTIEQLTPVGEVEQTDIFEVSGGRSIAFRVIAEKILEMQYESLHDFIAEVGRISTEVGTISTTVDLTAAKVAELEARADVLSYDGTVVSPSIALNYIGHSSEEPGVKIYLDTASSRFVLKYQTFYYAEWKDSARYNPLRAGVIYVNTSTLTLYTYAGGEFKQVGRDYGEEISELTEALNTLDNVIDNLVSGNATQAIESFNEVISFLEGVTDDEKLIGKLTAINESIAAEVAALEQAITAEADARAAADSELRQQIAEVTSPVAVGESEDGGDVDVTDEEGNVVARFASGHIRTKNFDSATILEKVQHPIAIGEHADEDTPSDLDLTDDEGNVALRVSGGHVKTKNFDSSKIDVAVDMPVAVGESEDGGDVDVTDDEGNVVARFADGHIRTKNFDSANVRNVYTDTVTGKRYVIEVANGTLTPYPAPINVLVLGNSFTRHGINTSIGWPASRGMAATVDENDYCSLLERGSGGTVIRARIGSDVGCVAFEQNPSASFDFSLINYDKSLTYDLIIVELSENCNANSATITSAWTALYRWLKTQQPQAAIIQLLGWNKNVAPITAACNAEGVELFHNYEDCTYVGQLAVGNYVTGANKSSVMQATANYQHNHPSDVGMLLAANKILQWWGYRPLGLLHAINVAEGSACVTLNSYYQGVAGGLITLSKASQPTVTAADGTAVEVTSRGSNLWTFFMPDCDVTIG